MNLHITTKQLNESGKIFFIVGAESARLLTCAACQPGITGAVKLGYNAGVYGWNYDVYMLVKKQAFITLCLVTEIFRKGLWVGPAKILKKRWLLNSSLFSFRHIVK